MVVTNVIFYRCGDEVCNTLSVCQTLSNKVGGKFNRFGNNATHDLAVFLIVIGNFLHDFGIKMSEIVQPDTLYFVKKVENAIDRE